jgi:hypothetical protein
MRTGHLRGKSGRPALALVPPLPEPGEQTAPARTVTFCSHCGAEPAADAVIGTTRVCGACGLGLLLQAGSDAAPAAGDAFVVTDETLSVCAVSAGAEQLLATMETDAINHPITRLLVPAEAEGRGANLAAAITWAARGDGAVHRTVVRPANTFGIRITARIAACGPRSAALLVFE